MLNSESITAVLLGEEIHVWPVRLRGTNEQLTRCSQALSPAELSRGARFRFDHLRRAFLLAHGCRRKLLAEYLGIAWGEIQFGYGSHGKPYIREPRTTLCFNQSDSKEIAVFAFAAGCEIGVDVEAIRRVNDQDEIAGRFFSRDENAELLSMPLSNRSSGFFAVWTRKEAFIKATGQGLRTPLDSFSVTVEPDANPQLLKIGGDPDAARDWHLSSFRPETGYVGAIAWFGKCKSVRVLPTIEAEDLLTKPGFGAA